jgi:hypothetical protein
MSNKIIYNVTVKVEIDVHQKWLNWMKRIHAADMMATGLFLEYKICRLLGVDEQDGITYAVQYTLPDMDAYMKYQAEHALRMQRDHKQQFEGKFVAFRTLMKVV